jgi:hypothetical protein
MSDNGTHASAPAAPRQIGGGAIKPIDPAQFGRKAELADKLKAILKDVPALHERMKKAVTDFEDVTIRAQAIVAEWEKVNTGTKV